MHATVLVLGEDVETLMDPYSEHDVDARDPQWDWWVIGGRWSGSLLTAEAGRVVTDPPYGLTLRDVGAGRWCDQVRRGCLDLDGMRAHAAARAEEVWAEVAPVLAEHGTPAARESIRDGESDPVRAAEVWRSQPGMEHLLRHVGLFDDPAREFACSHDQYLERARANAVPGYAFLSERTGWMRSRTVSAEWEMQPAAGYIERVNREVEEATDDTLVSLVDYHC